MMHTRNCKRVDKYLGQGQWDKELLWKMLNDKFGEDVVQ